MGPSHNEFEWQRWEANSNDKMAKGKGKFEQLWRREAGKFKAKEELRRAMARASKRRGTEGERSAVKWRNIRKEAQQKRAPVRKVQREE